MINNTRSNSNITTQASVNQKAGSSDLNADAKKDGLPAGATPSPPVAGCPPSGEELTGPALLKMLMVSFSGNSYWQTAIVAHTFNLFHLASTPKITVRHSDKK
jgi:hypothetical protein